MYETETMLEPAESEPEIATDAMVEYPILECRMNGRTLQAIVNHVCTLTDEARISITSEGWRIKVVDPAHIAMVDIVVTMQSFETWHYDGFQGIDAHDGEIPNEIGLDFEKVRDFLKTLGAKELKKSHTLRFTRKKLVLETEVGTREFSLINTCGMSDPLIPRLDLPSVFTIRSEDMPRLKTFLKGVSKISPYLELSTDGSIRMDTEPGLRVESSGDMDKTHIILPVWMNDGKTANAKSMFPLEYFDKIVRTLTQQKVYVTVSLGNDYPIKLECRGENGNFGLEVTYLLAPRIEDSD